MSSTLVRVLCWVSSLYLGFHDALFLSPRRIDARRRSEKQRSKVSSSRAVCADLLFLCFSVSLFLAMRSLTSFFFFLLVA
jgi:hypothetical protein